MLYRVGIDPRIGGSYTDSQNSGSEITMLFDRLRQVQQKDKEPSQKEEQMM